MVKRDGPNLTTKEIIKRQKELCSLEVLEEYKDYKITEEYLNGFLDKYFKLSGRYGYVQAAILLPLFKKIKEKNPNLSDEELVKKAHGFFPIIKSMLEHRGVFKMIDKTIKKSDKEIERELEEKKNGRR